MLKNKILPLYGSDISDYYLTLAFAVVPSLL